MPIVTYNINEEYSCAKAIKGPDYIHLLDEFNILIVAFDGIVDFSLFSIADGEWCIPVSDDDCFVAVVREDGTVATGSHRCRDIGTSTKSCSVVLPTDSWDKLQDGTFRYVCDVPGTTPTSHVTITALTNKLFVYNYLVVSAGEDVIYFFCGAPPSAECELLIKVEGITDMGTI